MPDVIDEVNGLREAVTQICETVLDLQADLSRANAIIDGTWPNADEIIASRRKKQDETRGDGS